MNEEFLQKQLEILWDRVQERVDGKNPGGSFSSAFDSAQSEIQAESLNMMRRRFEKEKSYWENLLASKEETISHLKKEIASEQEKIISLKIKAEDLQTGQAEFLKQSYETLDLQKRSMNVRIEQLEKELEMARKEVIDLRFQVREEKEAQKKIYTEKEEENEKWISEKDRSELAAINVTKALNERHQKELDEIMHLEETIKLLQNEMSERQSIHETEIAGVQNLIAEKDNRIGEIQGQIEKMKEQVEKEKEERRLASIERERESVQSEEDRKRLIEQLLNREEKIKELQDSLANVGKERIAEQEIIRKREQEIFSLEESVKKRREEWADSIKNQTSQQLNIAGKVVDIINRMEWKTGSPGSQASTPPPLPSSGKMAARTATGESRTLPGMSGAHAEVTSIPDTKNFFSKMISKPTEYAGKIFGRRKGIILVVSGLILFGSAALVWYLNDEGRRISEAQGYLQAGNEQFTKGELVEALKSLENAYELDPKNSIIINSLTLVLGELANKEYRDGKLEDALKRTEALNKLLPDDPDILQLHNNILQSLGTKSGVQDKNVEVTAERKE